MRNRRLYEAGGELAWVLVALVVLGLVVRLVAWLVG